MTQRDRDRLVVLKQAHKRQITQKQAGEQLQCHRTARAAAIEKLKGEGDKAILHGLRGRPSNRRRSAKEREAIVRILSQEVYHGFGPTLASEYLAKKHKLQIGREALRKLMMEAGLWQGRKRKVEEAHVWRQRRSSRGELVQWDTSEHDWLEGRGERFYLIHMIDDATSELTARFVAHDSTEENMRLLKSYLETHGRPVAFYTDKASLFQTAPKIARDQKEVAAPGARAAAAHADRPSLARVGHRLDGGAFSAGQRPRGAQFSDRAGPAGEGLRVAGAKTLEQANRYLETEFLPWWNQHLQGGAANATDAHRPLDREHDLAASLSVVETRQVANDYTIRFEAKLYQIARQDIRTGLRGANVRIESRLDGSLQVRFQQHYLSVSQCAVQPPRKSSMPRQCANRNRRGPHRQHSNRRITSSWPRLRRFPLWKAAQIDRTRTTDTLEE